MTEKCEEILQDIDNFMRYYRDEFEELNRILKYRFDEYDIEDLKTIVKMAEEMKEFIEELYGEVKKE